MRNERVKFYSANDLSGGFNLRAAEKVILDFGTKRTFDINDVIELWNIFLFFKNGIILSTWTQNIVADYSGIVKTFREVIGRYFGTIDNRRLISDFPILDVEYTSDFWALFETHKSYNRIDDSSFELLFNLKNFSLREVLRHGSTVEHYGRVLREIILSETAYATIIIDKYLTDRSNGEEINLPKELQNEEMNELVNSYIDSDNPNPNYLQLIHYGSEIFYISDETRLKALKKYREYADSKLDKSQMQMYGATVSANGDQKEEALSRLEDGIIVASYSTKWILDNLDYPTILNNFIYLFEYTDLQFRSMHVSKERYSGLFEQLIGVKGRSEYVTNFAFRQMQGLSILQMHMYTEVLATKGIILEEVFAWFFKNYMLDEFSAGGFSMQIPSSAGTYIEKFRVIVPEIEAILKKYSMYVKYGHIDPELLHISSTHLKFDDVPSLLTQKYIYGTGDTYNQAVFLLFSDQCTLSHIKTERGYYHTFYELIIHEGIRVDDCENHRNELDWLVRNGFIGIADGNITMHMNRILLLKDLHKNAVACKWHLGKYLDEIKWMHEKGMIEYESTLLSRQEQNYLNYLLNRSVFNNGKDLRNKYAHGTQSEDETTNKQDYCTLLNILVLIIIKINDELCIRYRERWSD